jgi:DUF4097 and DUF4098 domain-containing protein YvlB
VPYGANARDYWRFQKDQNRAAWRAQRSAWRAQRDVLRAQRRASRVPSVAGPIILIAVGIIALLLITGHLNSDQFWTVVGKWWPILLIGLGLVALAEWAIDLRRENPPVRTFGGYVWLIVLLIFLGAAGTGWHRYWGPLRAQMGDDDDNFFNAFGEPQHDLDQAVLNTDVPANAQIEIQDPRGDVSITSSDDKKVTVNAHQIAFASSDSEATKIFKSQEAHVSVSGNTVLVKVDGNNSGRTNLSLVIPRSASVNVTTGHGSVTASGLSGNLDAQVQHGNLEAAGINGHVHVRVSNDGDVSAHDIQGDVTIDGNGDNLTLTDIHGTILMQGDYTGDTHVERADQSVRFHSSRTDLEMTRLPGGLTLNSDGLHATEVVGPVRLICSRSKDVELNQVYGDTHIEDQDARVELGMAGSYVVEVKDRKGDVELSLPPSVSATVDARTRNGDIVSDFPLEISGDENKTANGTIGKGGPRIVLSTEHADLRIRKGEEFGPPTAISSMPKVPAMPKVPPVPGVPHLKASKQEQANPVSQ